MDPINPEIQALREQLAHAEKLAGLKHKGRVRAAIGVSLVAGAVMLGAGFFHFVNGEGVTLYPCRKTSWGISNTIVNTNDYVGTPMISLERGEYKVVKALYECELIDIPSLTKEKKRAAAEAAEAAALAEKMRTMSEEAAKAELAEQQLRQQIANQLGQ